VKSAQAAAELFAGTFEHIHRQQMTGLPMLNQALQVECLGFQTRNRRIIGIVITPWLMNLVMLPGEKDDWSGLKIGSKQQHEFPSRAYRFTVNEISGIGFFQTCSIYSPMHEFVTQAHAVAAAQSFLAVLMNPAQAADKDPVDEELLGRILRGEEPSGIKSDKPEKSDPHSNGKEIDIQTEPMLSRRELLSGSFRRSVANQSDNQGDKC